MLRAEESAMEYLFLVFPFFGLILLEVFDILRGKGDLYKKIYLAVFKPRDLPGSEEILISELDVKIDQWWFRELKGGVSAKEFRSRSNYKDKYRSVERFLAIKRLKLKTVFEGKDVQKAEELIVRAKDAYKYGKDAQTALGLINEAIRLSPVSRKREENVALAKGLAERAWILFDEERYPECIADIDSAIIYGYPRKDCHELLKKKFQAYLQLHRFAEAWTYLRMDENLLGVTPKDREEDEKLVKQIHILKGSLENGTLLTPKPMTYRFPGIADAFEDQMKYQLKGRRNRTFPALSNLCQLDSFSDEVNFVATEDISAGDVMLFEPPLVSCMVESYCTTNCYTCFRWTDLPHPCSTCSSVVFCSAACATDAKADLHDKECSFWKTFIGHGIMGPELVSGLRFVLTKTASQWREFMSRYPELVESRTSALPEGKFSANDPRSIFCLKDNLRSCPPELVFKFSCHAVFIMGFLAQSHFEGSSLDDELRFYIGGLMVKHMLLFWQHFTAVKDSLTTHDDVSDVTHVVVAKAIYPTKALLQPSCSPNLVISHFGDVLIAKALRSIQKGETLTVPHSSEKINYRTMNRRKRRERVDEFYGRECKCQACAENWLTTQESASRRDVYKCPCCGTRLGRWVDPAELFECDLKKCSACGASWRPIVRQINKLVSEAGEFFKATSREVDDEYLETAFGFIQGLRDVCEVPNHVLALGESRASACWQLRGNKRFVADSIVGESEVDGLESDVKTKKTRCSIL